MFEYANNPDNIKKRIGQYVAGYVIREKFGSSKIKAPKEINKLDRIDLAEKLIKLAEKEARVRFYDDLGDNYSIRQLIQDIAKFIDATIPKAYNKHVNNVMSYSIEGIALSYYFDDTPEFAKELQSSNSLFFKMNIMTDKQFSYLNTLLNKNGLREIEDISVIDRDNVNDLIDILKRLQFLDNEAKRNILDNLQPSN